PRAASGGKTSIKKRATAAGRRQRQGCGRENMSNSSMPRRLTAILASLALVASVTSAAAETADTVLFNGKVVTVDKDFSVREAIAIAHGRVLATGSSADMKKLAESGARLVDLGGRTVIPGLTDGHIHGIRAALTFGTEVNWIGVRSLKD